MILGVPPVTLTDGDLPMWKGGTLAPAGFRLTGSYTYTSPQIIDFGTGIMPFAVPVVAQTFIAANSGNNNFRGYSFGGAGLQFAGGGFGGTRDVPTPTANNQVMCRMIALGYDGTTFNTNALVLDMTANGLWSGTNRGSRITISGILNGVAATPSNWLDIRGTTGTDPTGTVSIGGTPTTGNGVVQLPMVGTTKDYGLSQSTDTFFFRVAAGAWSFNNGNPTANTFAGHLIYGRNNAAADTAGTVGETTNSKISTATNAAGTGTYLALTSLTLAAGKWRLAAYAEQVLNGATIVAASAIEMLIGTTSASNAGTTAGYDRAQNVNGVASTIGPPLTLSDVVVNITGSTTYYLNVLATFTVGTPQWRGSLKAERLA